MEDNRNTSNMFAHRKWIVCVIGILLLGVFMIKPLYANRTNYSEDELRQQLRDFHVKVTEEYLESHEWPNEDVKEEVRNKLLELSLALEESSLNELIDMNGGIEK